MQTSPSFFSALAAVAMVLVLVPACTAEETTPSAVEPDGGGATDDNPTDPNADAGASEEFLACTKKCKGCCLPDGKCIANPYWKYCGTKGSACITCDGDDRSCRSGKCGCTSSADCADGLVCDVENLKCKKPCTAESCDAGCCSSAGFCETNPGSTACGTSGACLDCRNNPTGTACIGGTKCGCNFTTDCPQGQSCDPNTKTCTTTCSATQPCNGGCCDGATNKCVGGLYAKQCGNTGGMCMDCADSPDGTACLSGKCGCTNTYSCPVGQACNSVTKKCGTACSTNQQCNGACCTAATNGTCQPGTANNACGVAFGMCTNCTVAGVGPLCLTSGVSNQVCGCNDQTDCSAPRECKAGAGRSYKWCCLPPGAFCVIGNNQCCSGSCSGIGGNTKCN